MPASLAKHRDSGFNSHENSSFVPSTDTSHVDLNHSVHDSSYTNEDTLRPPDTQAGRNSRARNGSLPTGSYRETMHGIELRPQMHISHDESADTSSDDQLEGSHMLRESTEHNQISRHSSLPPLSNNPTNNNPTNNNPTNNNPTNNTVEGNVSDRHVRVGKSTTDDVNEQERIPARLPSNPDNLHSSPCHNNNLPSACHTNSSLDNPSNRSALQSPISQVSENGSSACTQSEDGSTSRLIRNSLSGNDPATTSTVATASSVCLSSPISDSDPITQCPQAMGATPKKSSIAPGDDALKETKIMEEEEEEEGSKKDTDSHKSVEVSVSIQNASNSYIGINTNFITSIEFDFNPVL